MIFALLGLLAVAFSGLRHGRKMYDLGREHGRLNAEAERLESVRQNQSAAARAAKRWGMN